MRFRSRLALAALVAVVPLTAQAGCSTASTGARCVSVPERAGPERAGPERAGPEIAAAMSSASAASSAVAPGDVLRRGAYSILLNADYYGLPPVTDGWVYMRVGRDVFRVDWRSQQVLERVTDRAASNF